MREFGKIICAVGLEHRSSFLRAGDSLAYQNVSFGFPTIKLNCPKSENHREFGKIRCARGLEHRPSVQRAGPQPAYQNVSWSFLKAKLNTPQSEHHREFGEIRRALGLGARCCASLPETSVEVFGSEIEFP